jgi:hypothetical protein
VFNISVKKDVGGENAGVDDEPWEYKGHATAAKAAMFEAWTSNWRIAVACFGQCLQGARSARWWTNNYDEVKIHLVKEWTALIKAFKDEFALDGQTELGKEVMWDTLHPEDHDTFLDYIRAVQRVGCDAGKTAKQQLDRITLQAPWEIDLAINAANADSIEKIVATVRNKELRELRAKKSEREKGKVGSFMQIWEKAKQLTPEELTERFKALDLCKTEEGPDLLQQFNSVDQTRSQDTTKSDKPASTYNPSQGYNQRGGGGRGGRPWQGRGGFRGGSGQGQGQGQWRGRSNYRGTGGYRGGRGRGFRGGYGGGYDNRSSWQPGQNPGYQGRQQGEGGGYTVSKKQYHQLQQFQQFQQAQQQQGQGAKKPKKKSKQQPFPNYMGED